MVKRVFITSDLGDEGLPKWASWVRVVVDGMLPIPVLLYQPTYSSVRLQRRTSP